MPVNRICLSLTGALLVMGSTVETQQWYIQSKVYSWTGDSVSWRAGEGITEVPSDIPAEARDVRLYYNQIQVIRENDFNHLNVCEKLWLSYNKIHSIEEGAWNGLDSLKQLRLHENEIKELRGDTFTGLATCMYLSLHRNNIHTIHDGALDVLESLIELSLHGNKLTVLRSHTFSRLTKLRRLWLDRNDIKTIEPDCIFTNASTELTLKLHSNEFAYFPWTAFGKQHPLKLDLSLSSNPLVCNITLCWIKQGEQEGWITWTQDNGIFWGYRGTTAELRCDGTAWQDINLPCSHLGIKVGLH